MKPRILLTLLLVFVAFINADSIETVEFEAIITSDKNVYKIGEIPKIHVSIQNNSGKDVYLIGSLDGSDLKMRSPFCYFTIEKPINFDHPIARCGNMNPLREDDFVLVKSGETFDPYQKGFFGSYKFDIKENFQFNGTYRITFYYSTKSRKLNEYFGDDYGIDKEKVKQLFKKVPHIELTSNTLEIEFKK
jgi:hypothetical protein